MLDSLRWVRRDGVLKRSQYCYPAATPSARTEYQGRCSSFFLSAGAPENSSAHSDVFSWGGIRKWVEVEEPEKRQIKNELPSEQIYVWISKKS